MIKANKYSCAVINDLLPLYHDGVVSEETKAIIEEHLKDCKDCKEEYDDFFCDLPVEEQPVSTKRKFINMMARKNTKRIILTLICTVLACVLTVVGYEHLRSKPVLTVPAEEIKIERVYRYEKDGYYRFFVLYNSYLYGYSSGKIFAEDENTLVMEKTKAFLSKRGDKVMPDIWTYDCYEYVDGKKIFKDYSTVKFGDKVIWTAEENGDDEIPDYVYAYEDYEYWCGEGKVKNWYQNEKEGYISVWYKDGTTVTWDYDGNVIK